MLDLVAAMPNSNLVVLVAQELTGEENLGVRYVAQALKDDGFEVRLISLNGPSDIVPVAATITHTRCQLIGLSMSDNQVAVAQLGLTAYLRTIGFDGSIVAGGAFATVARQELLEQHPGLDAIIRREGEGPMVALARCLLRDYAPLATVAGVTTRSGDGPAYLSRGVTPAARPLRDARLPCVLGAPSARVMASRGCDGSCSYCGSPAIRLDAAREAHRLGMDSQQIRAMGVMAQRQRPLDDFAAEVTELYHQRGVRFFRLIDDHILGPNADTAWSWLEQLRVKLTARGVVAAAFSMMVEPSVVTDEVANAMQRLGVVRTLVGVEALTRDGLHALGRNPAMADRNRAVVERLHRRNIAVFYNSILIHPESTPASVRAELQALPLVPGVSFDTLALLVFPGTSLYKRLEREGKLLGGLLGCDYAIADPSVSRMRSFILEFHRRLPGFSALPTAAFDIDSLYCLAHRLEHTTYSRRRHRDLRELIGHAGALRQWVSLSLLELAEASPPPTQARRQLEDLVDATGPRMLALYEAQQDHRQRIERTPTTARQGQRRFGSALLSATLVAVGPGCGGEVTDSSSNAGPSTGGTAQGGVGSTGLGGKVVASGGATSPSIDTTSTIGGNGANATAGTAGTAGAAPIPGYLATDCNSATNWAINDRLLSLARVDCNVDLRCGSETLVVSVDKGGAVVDITVPSGAVSSMTAEQFAVFRSCMLSTLATEHYPCLTDGFAWQSPGCRLIL